MKRIAPYLASPVDGDFAVWFRIVFGLVSAWWVAKQFTTGAIEAFYVAPTFHFHYWGFDWIQPFSASMTYVEFGVLGLAALMISVGVFYRLASLVFAIGFTHLFLVDKCLYQNHYYLMCLLAWLMVVLPANRELSIDVLIWPHTKSKVIPHWTLWLLRFQLGLPYFYGGIAKLNTDWLAGEPMHSMLKQRTDFPIVGEWLSEPWCVLFFVYGGILFDLLFVPAVLTRRFRALACGLAVVFHGTNAFLFTIGVFPWLMLLAIPVFLPPGLLRKRVLRQHSVDAADVSVTNSARPLLYWLTIGFVAWQVILPLRHFAIPGKTSWTEEGHCFSWRMLVRGKQPALRLIATDPKSGKSGAVDLRPFVTEYQLHRVAREPRLIQQLVHYVADNLRGRGFEDIQIRAFSLVSLNGRKPQLMIDRRVDLTKAKLGFNPPDWIVPLTEPLRDEPWDVPMADWERVVKIPVGR